MFDLLFDIPFPKKETPAHAWLPQRKRPTGQGLFTRIVASSLTDQSTVLSNGVKVAESGNHQKCQKLTKVGLAPSRQSY